MKKMERRFRMHESKYVTTHLEKNDKLSTKHNPNLGEEMSKMELIPHARGVGSIMYGMVCSKLDLLML